MKTDRAFCGYLVYYWNFFQQSTGLKHWTGGDDAGPEKLTLKGVSRVKIGKTEQVVPLLSIFKTR